MTHEEIRAGLAPVRCFLLDMDGTFYLGDRLIDGSLDFLSALERTGRTARFLTNNSSKSASVYAEKLRRLGVPEQYRDVISSGHAAAHYCMRHFPGQKGFLMGNPMLAEELTGMGLLLTEDADADYVLAAFDTTLDYPRMCRVCDLIREGKPYIATHPDFNCPTETGFIPDSGAIAAFVTASTGKVPTYFGKPYRETVEMISEATGISRDKMCIFGDRLYTDIALGKKHGVTAVLVLSGETTPEDVDAASPAEKPDYVFPSLDEVDRVMFG